MKFNILVKTFEAKRTNVAMSQIFSNMFRFLFLQQYILYFKIINLNLNQSQVEFGFCHVITKIW